MINLLQVGKEQESSQRQMQQRNVSIHFHCIWVHYILHCMFSFSVWYIYPLLWSEIRNFAAIYLKIRDFHVSILWDIIITNLRLRADVIMLNRKLDITSSRKEKKIWQKMIQENEKTNQYRPFVRKDWLYMEDSLINLI